ncbi:MAG: hypothetical protein BRC52_01885 [Cyanobacteria bacterium SW_5_48_44]|nr:MAG: hypothetical protein BRC46_11570 [Cyanobacteria bacterium QS_6_48_18]PSP23561.1 MAG: hypothetical protein BRC52_01885 [Cyanobacteria bacterium SW_5_48_44]
MGWFDRKIYFYFQHSHALTLSRSHALTSFPQLPASARSRVPASSSSPAPGAPLLFYPLPLEILEIFLTHSRFHASLPLNLQPSSRLIKVGNDESLRSL